MTKQEMLALAQANVNKHLGDVAGEYETAEELAEAMPEEVYVLAFDALADAGVEHQTAAKVAAELAAGYETR